MKNNYSFFYHLQIAKCGGTYLNNMIIHELFNILQKNNIPYIDGENHLGWQQFDNIYTISCFRDPVRRTISHYAYYKDFKNREIKFKDFSKFILWVKQNEEFMSNYQIKNFFYIKKNLNKSIFDPRHIDKDFSSIKIDKENAFNRIKNTNILLKNSQLNNLTCFNVMEKIINDFNLKEKTSIDLNKNYDHNITGKTQQIYDSLTKKEIDYLYEINNLDSEIYFSNNLYFNGGV